MVRNGLNYSVSLTWADNSAHETGFVVQRSADGGTWVTIATLPADTTAYTDASVSTGTTYYYFDCIV